MCYRLSIAVDDKNRTTKVGEHRGKKTKTESSFGYYLGGMRRATVNSVTDQNNSPTWSRFVGCMSEVYIEKVQVDFAKAIPQGDYADYSTCWVPDPVAKDEQTEPGVVTDIRKYLYYSFGQA